MAGLSATQNQTQQRKHRQRSVQTVASRRWPSVLAAAPVPLLLVLLVSRSAAAQPSPDVEETPPRLDVPIIHSLGVMTIMRTSEAVIWPDPFANTDPYQWANSYGRALRQAPRWDGSLNAFEWDGDHWTINVIGHGIFGSELYFRPRRCGQDMFTSVLFATAASATWEYMFEGNEVQPSGLDLWFTPAAGWLLGELRFQGWKAASGINSSFWRQTTQIVLDPLGSIERAGHAPC